MALRKELFHLDPNIEPCDPAEVYQLQLASGRMMPAAALGTFHSDWAQE